jgi:hypothetical protein
MLCSHLSPLQVNRQFGPYTADMWWGEPSEAAAVHAMRLLHSYPAHYASLAAGEIRERATTLLSPANTGSQMKARLQLLFDCLNVVHGNSSPPQQQQSVRVREVCVRQVLGRRREEEEEEEEGAGAGRLRS